MGSFPRLKLHYLPRAQHVACLPQMSTYSTLNGDTYEVLSDLPLLGCSTGIEARWGPREPGLPSDITEAWVWHARQQLPEGQGDI